MLKNKSMADHRNHLRTTRTQIPKRTNQCHLRGWGRLEPIPLTFNEALTPWLVWLSGLSAGLRTKRSPVRFPVRAHAWVVGQVPSRGHTRGNHTLMFLSLSFSLPSPLSKNKQNLKKKKKKQHSHNALTLGQ